MAALKPWRLLPIFLLLSTLFSSLKADEVHLVSPKRILAQNVQV